MPDLRLLTRFVAAAALSWGCQSGEPSAKPSSAARAPEPSVVLSNPEPSVALPRPVSPKLAAAEPSREERPTLAPGERKIFGDALTESALTPLVDVIAKPAQYADKTVLVEGSVRRACSRRGCWMELATSEQGPACRVTFKDYGFFVPLDSAGAQARVQAVVEKATLRPRDVRHHEREGAQFPNKNPDGSADETRLVASGVELWR